MKNYIGSYFSKLALSRFYVLLIISPAFILGWLTHFYFSSMSAGILARPIREKAQSYKFISPLLASGDSEVFRGFAGLTSDMSRYITEQKIIGRATEVSVFMKDLNSTIWTGIDEDRLYAPASMMKVALLLSYLKAADVRPDVLSQSLLYKGLTESRRIANGPTLLVSGERYSVPQLLRYMIINSDNDAKDLLQQLISDDERMMVFNDLGLTMPSLENNGDFYSPKEFSIFFRVLYNSTYLSQDFSESALDLLSNTEYKEGIVSGVPENITVAHKFGRREFRDAQHNLTALELHDCGIVYYPSHPYFICVMTKGNNDAALQGVIQKISFLAYQEIDDSYKN